LPPIEREAFDLLFYQELSQAEAAAVLAVSVRTIKRRWQSARLRLVQNLGGKMPGL
jgi:DNA-directed RNA polymerase specialized sigma24 family protein